MMCIIDTHIPRTNYPASRILTSMSTPQCGTRMRMCPICTTSIGTIGEAGCHYSSFAGSTNIRGATVIGLLPIHHPKKTPPWIAPGARWVDLQLTSPRPLGAYVRQAALARGPKTKLRRLRSSFTRQSGPTPKRTAMAYEFRTKCTKSGALETNGRRNFVSAGVSQCGALRAKARLIGESSP